MLSIGPLQTHGRREHSGVVRYHRKTCLAHVLELKAADHPGATAILARQRSPLTYDRLSHHVRRTRETLNALGVGRNDRVALIAESQPEMAVAFLAIAASATCAPLNPSYRAPELDSYLSDLDVRALVIEAGLDSPARTVAQRRGIAVLEMTRGAEAEAGVFALTGAGLSRAIRGGPAEPDDIALVLHTSGTTSRPKKVPLTHTAMCISARNIAAILALTSQDRCLSVMPLYHIHGLVAGILASLTATGSVIFPPKFEPAAFFAWLDEFRPTWYTAAPTLHQAILLEARHYPDIVKRRPLRFIRSTSAALPPRVLAEMETVFGAPVIEAYSMTEAAHQVCTNPLPPRTRKTGSVGLPAGPHVAIMDETGNLVVPGIVGEIVIRGPSIIRSYEGNAEVNRASFRNGWFRTGDQGVFDADGYLFIKGRLREVINRGGEKISPREVDEVLLDHPGVAQAMTFPLPHPMLGEDIAAAVVPRENATVSEASVRQHVSSRLAGFKVPCRVLIVDELPKGPTGKLQRRGLAERFSHLLGQQFVPPRTQTEKALAKLWADVLGVQRVGIHDNFFELGGTSLASARLAAEIETLTGRNFPLATFLRAPTISELVDVLHQAESETQWRSLVSIQTEGSRPPFFCIHTIGGNIVGYRDLALHLGRDQPFFALQQQGLDGKSALHRRIEDMAAHYVHEIRAVQPEGPYFLGGHSTGGLIAYEAALQLSAQGQRVALLALIDTFFPTDRDASAGVSRGRLSLPVLPERLRFHLDNLCELGPRHTLPYLVTGLGRLRDKFSQAFAPVVSDFLRHIGNQSARRASRATTYHPILDEIVRHNRRATAAYVPRRYPGRVTLFLGAAPRAWGLLRSRRTPERLADGGVEVYRIPGDHVTVVMEPRVRILAEELRDAIDRAMTSLGDSDLTLVAAGGPSKLKPE